MGRLKPGVTAAQVQANLEGVFQHTARAGLDAYLASLAAEARSTVEQPQPHAKCRTCASIPAAAASTTSTRPTCARSRS